MFFFFSKFFGGLADPAVLLSLAILAGAVATFMARRRLAAGLQILSAVLVLLLGILPCAEWLAIPLEDRFAANPALPDHVAGIITLGGTERVEQSAVRGEPILSDPAPIVALITLGRRYPAATLVFAGGIHARADERVSEATIVRDFLRELGAGDRPIIYEDHSRNTYENAKFSHDLIHPRAGERWILVCPAIGMPRAVGVFRRAGWDVIPYPAGYLTTGRGAAALSFDLLGGLSLASTAVHEWLGLIVYRLMGYTDALFPG